MSDLLQRLDQRASLAGLIIDPSVSARLVAYYELLERWNWTINLTSLRDPDDAIDRLLLEPMAAARHLPSGPRLMDVGSGGGSPAIPLALGLGATSLVMVESNARKAAFLREATRQLDISDARVLSARLETLSPSDVGGIQTLISIRAVRLESALLAKLGVFLERAGQIALFSSASSRFESPGAGFRLERSHSLLATLQSELLVLRSV